MECGARTLGECVGWWVGAGAGGWLGRLCMHRDGVVLECSVAHLGCNGRDAHRNERTLIRELGRHAHWDTLQSSHALRVHVDAGVEIT